jgi:hypothetical protein
VNNEQVGKARKHLAEFEQLFGELDDETKNSDAEVTEQWNLLKTALG